MCGGVHVSMLMCAMCEKCCRLCVGVKLAEGMLIHSDRPEQGLYSTDSSLDSSQAGEPPILAQLQ